MRTLKIATLLRKHGGKTSEELKAEGKSTNPTIHTAIWPKNKLTTPFWLWEREQERRSKTIQYSFDITSFTLDTYVTNEIHSIVN